MAKLICAECGKPIKNSYHIDGRIYGYNCYRQKMALLYQQWEEEKNAERNGEYAIQCFAAMQIFQGKKGNSFHDSICKQWKECGKLTAKQLNCIISGFTDREKVDFWLRWWMLTDDDQKYCGLRWSIPSWIYPVARKIGLMEYMENEMFLSCMSYYNGEYYKCGYHFVRDTEDEPDDIWIIGNGKDQKTLKEDMEDEWYEVLKVVQGCQE